MTMMRRSAVARDASRRGITLLEVLITMFVLTVGILSVFGLFTAGRELSARAELRGRATAYAAGQGRVLADAWMDVRQWQHHDGTARRWVRAADALQGADMRIRLPVLIDPWGLSREFDDPSQRLPQGAAYAWDPNPQGMSDSLAWDWNLAVPLTSGGIAVGGTTVRVFPRITLCALENVILPAEDDGPPSTPADPGQPRNHPFSRETLLANLADPDAVEYRTPADDIPTNIIEEGRRKRGTDLVPALFLAAPDGTSGVIGGQTLLKRTLLIFHKPVPSYEAKSTADGEPGGAQWPAGSLEYRVLQLESDLLRMNPTHVSSEDAVVRRALKPGNWLLLVRRRGPDTGPYEYDTCWRKMTSVTEVKSDTAIQSIVNNGNLAPRQLPYWLVVLNDDVPAAWPRSKSAGFVRTLRDDWQNSASTAPLLFGRICAYTFESLVHLEQLPDAALLNVP